MNIGIKGEKQFTVTKDQLACNVGSGLVSVFATPDDDRSHREHCCRQCSR